MCIYLHTYVEIDLYVLYTYLYIYIYLFISVYLISGTIALFTHNPSTTDWIRNFILIQSVILGYTAPCGTLPDLQYKDRNLCEQYWYNSFPQPLTQQLFL